MAPKYTFFEARVVVYTSCISHFISASGRLRGGVSPARALTAAVRLFWNHLHRPGSREPLVCPSPALPKRGPPSHWQVAGRAAGGLRPRSGVSAELSWLGPEGRHRGADAAPPRPPLSPWPPIHQSPQPTPGQARRRPSGRPRRPDLLEFQHKGNPQPQEVHHQEGGSGRGKGVPASAPTARPPGGLDVP